jgi:hypothetical protein
LAGQSEVACPSVDGVAALQDVVEALEAGAVEVLPAWEGCASLAELGEMCTDAVVGPVADGAAVARTVARHVEVGGPAAYAAGQADRGQDWVVKLGATAPQVDRRARLDGMPELPLAFSEVPWLKASHEALNDAGPRLDASQRSLSAVLVLCRDALDFQAR